MRKKRKLFVKFLRKGILIGMICLGVAGCQPVHQKIEPIIIYTPTSEQITSHPSAFPPLTKEEQAQSWAKELIVADAFARELDLYRAITFYKGAKILLPPQAIERRLQIDYDIVLCYYLGRKYQEAIEVFEESSLIGVSSEFPAFNNLVIMIYDCYRETHQCEKAEAILNVINTLTPETAQNLSLYHHIKEGELEEAREESAQLLCQGESAWEPYDLYAKSPQKARFLNAILPGAGYYYVGQKKSALTSLIINSLFAAAAYQFFKRGYVAAGLITTSLEAGWYLGGINGAGIEAQEFNNRLYEGTGHKILAENRLFPVLMFDTTF